MKTVVYKSTHGWKAESTIDLADNRQLSVTTMKRYNGKVSTTATVGKIEGNCVSHVMYQDYCKTVGTTDKRATEKSITDFHNSTNFNAIITDVENFYQ